MFLKENILLAIAGLKSNKVRSLLTMLGIIIGIGSVIAIVSIGNALTASVSDTMSSLGANNIRVSVVQAQEDTGVAAMRGNLKVDQVDDNDLISMEQIQKFQEKYSDQIADISLTENVGSAKVKDGRLYANVSITGASAGYFPINNVTLKKGRFLNDRDVDQLRKVAVVSDKMVSNLFKSGEDPLGKEINVYENDEVSTYLIIGVYQYEESAMTLATGTQSEKDISTPLYIPVTVAKVGAQNQNYQSFSVKTKSDVDTASFTKLTDKYFTNLYQNNERYKCSVINMESMLSSATTMLNNVSIAVAAIAAIALLVGGIGVMNIMLVSVTERTREIGTRKALGARSSYIRVQFIVESIIICVIGGIIGILLGIGLAAIGVHLLKATLVISVPIIFISVGFSMLIGIFFGYYPANKAASLDPIEALRYE